jgi:hypothetical protein
MSLSSKNPENYVNLCKNNELGSGSAFRIRTRIQIQILCGSGSETLQRQQFNKVLRPKFTVLRQKSNLADKTEIDCNKETQFSCRYINYTEV